MAAIAFCGDHFIVHCTKSPWRAFQPAPGRGEWLGMAVLPNNLSFVACARCGEAMQLIRSVPHLGELPALHVFVCPSCGDVETKPMPSEQTAPRQRPYRTSG
jgi:hypothetical protein